MNKPAPAQQAAAALKPISWATWLGYAGLIPFVSLALGLRFLPAELHQYSVFALTAYAATITSFLGAIHWGLAMRDAQSTSAAASSAALFAWGVVPSLVAWIAILLAVFSGTASGQGAALRVLGVLLWVCYAIDRTIYPKFQLQNWLPMRLRLTLVASVSCFYAATL